MRTWITDFRVLRLRALGTQVPATMPAQVPVEPEAAPRVRSAALKLFLVEDSKLLRERLAERLAQSCGMVLVGWDDTEQGAIESLRRVQWDVLVVDLQLRQGTGMGVLRAVDNSERPPDTLVVMLTDHNFYLYRRKALEIGADLFCVKGRDLDLLVRALRSFAGRRAANNPH